MPSTPFAEAGPGPVLTPVDFDPFADATTATPLPLSEAQGEIWSAVQMGPEASCAYNLCFALRLEGAVSLEALRTAVQGVFDRHEALRVTFDATGERQLFRPPAPLDLPLEDLSELPASERGTRLAAILASEADTPFDLVEGPVARVRVVREAPDRLLLILTVHHIACDGWSVGVFFQELTALYDAACRGASADLPPAMQFGRFLEQDAEPGRREAAVAAQAFWRARFEDGVPVLDLPLDRPRPPIKTYRGASVRHQLDAALSAAVRRIAALHGSTVAGLTLAAFQVLLYRLSGQADVVVGLPVSVRPPADGWNLIGHVTNLLPVRLRLEGQSSFSTHLRAARAALLDAQEHRDLTFGTLVRGLNLKRDPSRTPLVTVTFNLAGGAGPRGLARVGGEVLSLPRTHVNFELELNVADTGRELELECSFNADLFAAETVTRWLGHYQTLLAGIAANPETTVDLLPLLTAGEREALRAWNRTETPGGERCVHELIADQAERTPARVAVEFEGTTLRYGELERRACQVAERLRVLGVGPGVRVGVFMERSPEMVVGLLGVLKAGGAYVPLDPGFPAERLSYMVEDSGAAVLLTDAAGEEDLPSRAVPVLRVDDGGAAQSLADVARVQLKADPDDVVYVIYTSGSTGRPKGVAVTHRSLANLLESMGVEPGLNQDDVLLSVTTLSFDIAALELYLPLMKGAKLALATRDEALDGRRLMERLSSSRATAMQATPATWRMLVDSGWEGTAGLKVLCGGEALARDLANDLLRRGGEVWNLYGPTETTVWSAAWRVEPGESVISIGRPIANTQLWVLDARLAPQPIGVPGELYIGGVGVARGYWRQPDLTAERFVPDPFSGAAGARLYRTGDLARWLPGGRLECLGRIDHQVKARGFRIELGEIEVTLRDHPGVESAVVVAQTGGVRGTRLVAFLTQNPSVTVNQAALRQHLKARLPGYMVPSSFVFLERLPLTPNGKVDRRAILQIEGGGDVVEGGTIPPRTPMEILVGEAWKEALGLSQVGVRDNFFDLGGHSLLAIRVLSAIEKQTGLRLHPREIMFQTLEQMAAQIAAGAPPGEATRRPGQRGGLLAALRGLLKASTPGAG